MSSHPGLTLLAAAVLVALLRGRARAVVALAAPVVALALALLLPDGVHARVQFLGHALVPFAVDPLSRLFAVVFSAVCFVGALFALNQERRAELPAAFVYAGAAIGACLAGDLLSLFVCWELMALASTVVVWSSATPAAYAAGMRYALVHLLGGMVLLVGIAAHAAETGTLAFTAMALEGFPRYLILGAFLLNAAAWPLSAWLPDAYPEASWSGMVFLSAFTTKTAVYALLRGFPGAELLVVVGLVMVFYGIVYALLENDMRRILAYSIVNQVGFMVTGIGLGTEMALNGAAAHAFTHILYKALLLMSAGSVLFMTGRRKCTDLGGLYHSMPFTTACGIVGALAISAFPLTSGFVSKSMIAQAAADRHVLVVWLLLAAASAGVFLHAGIKFPWFVFFQKDSGLRPPDPPWNMRAAMGLAATLCIVLGIFYEPVYALLPSPPDYVPYTSAHVVSQLQLLAFSGAAFFALLGLLRRTLTVTLDTDWLYRVLARRALVAAEAAAGMAGARASAAAQDILRALQTRALRLHGPQGLFARSWPSGSMALGMMAMLLALLASYYLA